MIVRTAREQLSAGGLALLVHVVFFAALIFGVSWKTLPEAPIYADLWRALPSPPTISAPEPAPPNPPPPRVAGPEKPLPTAKPVLPRPDPAEAKRAAEIALEEKKAQAVERKRKAEAAELERQRKLDAEAAERQRKAEAAEQEKQRKAALERQRQEEALALRQQREKEARERQQAERQRKMEEELERVERERLVQEERQLQVRREQERKASETKRLAQEKLRRDMEALMEAETSDDLAEESRILTRQVAVQGRMKLVEEYKVRIQMKVKGLFNIPPGVTGKPEAVYRVELLPNGEVIRAVLVKPSGQAAYDRAVENAILKASPFPLPSEKDAAAAFRDALELKFRPD